MVQKLYNAYSGYKKGVLSELFYFTNVLYPYFRLELRLTFFYFFLLRLILLLAIGFLNFYTVPFFYRLALYFFLLPFLFFLVHNFRNPLIITCYSLLGYFLPLRSRSLFSYTFAAIWFLFYLATQSVLFHFAIVWLGFTVVIYLKSELLLSLLFLLLFLRSVGHLLQRPFAPDEVACINNLRLYTLFSLRSDNSANGRRVLVPPVRRAFTDLEKLSLQRPLYVCQAIRFLFTNNLFRLFELGNNFAVRTFFPRSSLISFTYHSLFRREPWLALGLDPSFAFSYLNYGMVYLRQGYPYNLRVELLAMLYFFLNYWLSPILLFPILFTLFFF